jgi:hypothetical protein
MVSQKTIGGFMKREILDVVTPGRCCPGHDIYPDETYKNRRSKQARSRDIRVEQRHARRVKNQKLRNLAGEDEKET